MSNRQVKALKKALLPALAKADVATVEITYDGAGDSGQIQHVKAYTPTGKIIAQQHLLEPLTLPGRDKPTTLFEAIDDFAWDVLGIHHDGFWNNDGGFGTITIDVASGRITIDHNDCFVDSVSTVTEV